MLTQSAFNPHSCWVCDEPIEQLKKAHSLSVGAGLGLQAHPECIASLQTVVEDNIQEKKSLDEAMQQSDTYWEAWQAFGTNEDGTQHWIKKAVPVMSKHYTPNEES